MQMMKRTLGMFLVLITLGGCAYLPGSPTDLSEPPHEVTSGQTVLPTLPDTPTQVATKASERTLLAGLATIPVTPQPNRDVTTPGANVTLSVCQLEQVTQPP